MKKLLGILGAVTLIGTVSTSVVACDGGEKPTPPTPDTRTDLSGLSDNVEITLSSSTETVADFKTALINKLKEDLKFKKLSDTEVDITKSDSTEIQNSDIVDSTLVTKVKAKSTSTNFNGEKNINVTITINDTRIDISTKIPDDINLGQLDANSKVDFLAKLQTALARITDLNSITASDYDVYKAGTTTAISDSDITARTSLNIKIVAKGSKFQGTKDNIKVSYIQIDFTTMIKIRNLGKIIMQKDIPNKDELLKAIKDKNPSTTKFLTTDDFEFKEPITSNNATIIGKNKYKGEIILSFAINGIIIKFKNNYIFQYKRISVPIFVEKDLWPEVIKKSEFPSDLSKNITDYNYERLGDGIWVAIINSQITHKPFDFWFNVKNKYNNKIIKIYGFLQR